MEVKRIIMLLIMVVGFLTCLSGVNAADVSIDNSTWSISEIANYFNGLSVHNLTISDGDNVIFQEGNYLNLALSVKNSVNIIANGAVNFLGKGESMAIRVNNANNVNITGFNISNYTFGIYASRSNNTGVFNNNIVNNSKNGITLDASFNTTMVNNTLIKNKERGIYLSSSNNSKVINNTISDSSSNGGIVAASAVNSYLSGNIINHNIDGIYVYLNSNNTTILNNIIANNTNNGIVLGSFTALTTNSTVANNTINNNTYQGIRVINTVNTIITANNISNSSSTAMTLSNAVNSTVTDNNVSNNRATGISLSSSGNSTLKNNTVTNNRGSGITLSSSGGSNVSDNVVSNNTQNGITISGSGKSTVTNNTVNNNTLSGIRLDNSGNSVTKNSARGNGVGVSIYAINNTVDDNELQFNVAGVLVGYNNAVIVLGRNNISNNLYGLTITGRNDTLTNFAMENNTNGIIVNGVNNILNKVNSSNNLNAGLIFNSTSSGSLFVNGSLVNNSIGAVMNGKNDSVLSSNILKNTFGLVVNGSNNTLNYNRIYQNNLGLNNTGINTNANVNWWGINNAPTQVTNSGTNLNMSYWYVLQLSANNFNTTVNATQIFNAGDLVTLGYSLETNVPVSNNKDRLPYFEVTVTQPDGSVVSGDIRNTTVSYNFTVLKGSSYMGALADDENLKLFINTPSSDLAINKTVSNSKPNLNDKIVYTITVTNNGPDNATGVYVMDLLPEGLKFVSANGNYNSTTGIWTIGDLENGETAVLHIIAQVISSSVNITNTATVNHTNYDPNDTNDQSSTIITVGKDPNKDNSGTGDGKDQGNTVNAKTVTMHDTGVPIVLLLMALLAVFGGIVLGRK